VSRKRGEETAYLVGWPGIGIVKGGYTSHRRWRDFQIRGAVVLALWIFEHHSAAFAAESIVDRCLARLGQRAFRTAVEAEPFLGHRGGGYLECYRLPAGMMLSHAREQCSEAVLVGSAHGGWVSYARTDGRTDGESTHPPRASFSSVTRARAYDDLSMAGVR
jgi:hypothetical protein